MEERKYSADRGLPNPNSKIIVLENNPPEAGGGSSPSLPYQKPSSPKSMFNRLIHSCDKNVNNLLLILAKLPDDDTCEGTKGFLLAFVILKGVLKNQEEREKLEVWCLKNRGTLKANNLQRLMNSASKLGFFWNKPSLPRPIPTILSELSANLNLEHINQVLFSLISEGKFPEMAEWFVENQDTPQAKRLREKLVDGLPKNKQPWYALLANPDSPYLYDSRVPLKPHFLLGATLKGFKELHPFELLLGEYCRLQRKDTVKKNGVYYISFCLDKAFENAATQDVEGLKKYLNTACSLQKNAEGELSECLKSVQQLASIPVPDTDFPQIEKLLSTEKEHYEKKYQAYLMCGMPSNTSLLEAYLIHLTKKLEEDTQKQNKVDPESLHALFTMVENECQRRPSSVTYFYYAVVCKMLALYFATLETAPESKEDGINYACFGNADRREFYVEEAMYGIKVSVRLFKHDSHIVHNAFQGKGFAESNFLKPFKMANEMTPGDLEQFFLTQLSAAYLAPEKDAQVSQRVKDFERSLVEEKPSNILPYKM